MIPHGGIVVIGQDQDDLGGGFENRDAFGPVGRKWERGGMAKYCLSNFVFY